MNVIESVNEDEDFPVFKAGPPLPIRTKSSTKSQRERERNTKINNKNGPLLPMKAPSSTPLTTEFDKNTNTAHSSSSGLGGLKRESKVKKYIERVKASDELGRKNRIKPERMLSLEDLYQITVNPSPRADDDEKEESRNRKKEEPLQGDLKTANHNNETKSSKENDKLTTVTDVQDKLRETLRIVKEKDELINKLRESCHDLAIKCADAENRVDELRFSFGRSTSGNQEIKPNHRGSICGDINKIGQFSFASSNLRKCASDEGLNICHDSGNGEKQRKGKHGKVGKAEIKPPIKRNPLKQNDKQTQIQSGSLCEENGDGPCDKNDSDKEVGHWQDDDDILQETCSNWIEKVQNWKTDSNFNLSQDSGGDRDSGFRGSAEIDMESVRKHRHSSLPRSTSRKSKCQGHHHHHHKENVQHRREAESSSSKLLLQIPSNRFYSTQSSAQMSAQAPQMSSSSATTITGTITGKPPHPHAIRNEEAVVYETDQLGQRETNENQHFWPSFSSSQSHFNLSQYQTDNLPSSGTKAKSLFYELAEADRNKCTYFHKKENDRCCMTRSNHHRHHCHCKNSSYHRQLHHQHHYSHRLCEAKSLDVLYLPSHKSSNSEELRSLIDSSLEPPEFILKAHLDAQHRSIDKTVKILDPLLNDTTEIALRVKKKSERLAKMLQDACTFE